MLITIVFQADDHLSVPFIVDEKDIQDTTDWKGFVELGIKRLKEQKIVVK